MLKTPLTQKPTLIKYIHGWLATKKRRGQEGAFRDSLCPLCGAEESKYHFLVCSNAQLNTIREAQWKYLTAEVIKHTTNGCCQVFQAGLDTTKGKRPPSPETREGWPLELREAYSSQELIGWDQVLLGRIAQDWEQIARHDSSGDIQQRSWTWTKQVIRIVWKYGLTLWQSRNSMVHGIEGSVLILDHTRTLELVKAMYSDLLPEVQCNRQDIFPLLEREMLEQTHQSQAAWLAKL